MLRGRPTNRVRMLRVAGSLASIALVGLACTGSPPVRALRAARYYAAGTRALDRGDVRGAIEALEQAARFVPDASEIQNHLGLAYWSGGRSDDALRALERAVELDCGNEAARANLARLRAGMEVSTEASAGASGIDGGGRSEAPLGDAVGGSVVHGG